jgi:AcrR family transcriptional regulator
MTKAEQNKARRREVILSAARDLFRETGEMGLSMRALAKRACVSVATHYNLFGSKQAVMIALLDLEAAKFYEEFQVYNSLDNISRIFEFLDLSFELYKTDPKYFEALLRSLHRSEDAELRQQMRRPRAGFLKRLLREAVASGDLRTEISIGLVGRQLFAIHLFFIQEWIYGNITLDRAKLETEFGYCVLLHALGSDDVRTRLMARILDLETAID